MTAKEARHHDDGQDDPDNPVVPFRMSDRRDIWALQLKVTAMLWLLGVGASFAASTFIYVVMRFH